MSIIVTQKHIHGHHLYITTTTYPDGSAMEFTYQTGRFGDKWYHIEITPSGVYKDALYKKRLAERGLALA